MPNIRRTQRFSKTYRDFSGGVQELTSPLWMQDNESPFATDVDIRKPGILGKSLGYSEAGSGTASGRVKGLGVFEKEDGTYTLLKVHDNDLHSYTGSGWTNLYSPFTSNSTDKATFTNAFLDNEDRIYITTGHNDNLFYYNGSASGSVSNVKAKHMDLFNNRLYLANVKLTSTTYPIRVQYSGLGVDTFDTTNDFFDDVGEPIEGLKTYAGKLHVWTENKLFAYDGYSLTEIPGDYGTKSARSIQIVEGRLLWHNRGGVFMYAGAGLPTLISRKIQGWIDVISSASNVAGGIDSKGRYLLYIGDVTYQGTSYTDVCLRYDVLNNTWEVLLNRPYGVFALQKSGGTYISYAGDVDNDKVWIVDGAQGLNGSTLPSEWQTPKYDAGEPEDQKNFYAVDITYKPQNVATYVTVKYRIDGSSSWSQIGGTTNNIDLSGTDLIKNARLVLPANTAGKFIQLQFTHSSSSSSFEIYEIKLVCDMYRGG